jgi:hypothetical protein
MQTYSELVELARLCLKQASLSTRKSISAELVRLAKHYQERAAKLDGGKLPYIGEE